MAFILASDGRDDDVVGSFKRYQHYLASVRDAFPRGAFEIATSDWYFDFNDRRCPHDAWLESCNIREISSCGSPGPRTLSVTLRLPEPYQDRYIELHYPRVFAYKFDVADGDRSQCDWLYDELRLSERGNLVHAIEWWGPFATGTWIIEASELELRARSRLTESSCRVERALSLCFNRHLCRRADALICRRCLKWIQRRAE